MIGLPAETVVWRACGATDMLARLQGHPAKQINELLPWNWKRPPQQKAAA